MHFARLTKPTLDRTCLTEKVIAIIYIAMQQRCSCCLEWGQGFLFGPISRMAIFKEMQNAFVLLSACDHSLQNASNLYDSN